MACVRLAAATYTTSASGKVQRLCLAGHALLQLSTLKLHCPEAAFRPGCGVWRGPSSVPSGELGVGAVQRAGDVMTVRLRVLISRQNGRSLWLSAHVTP